MLPAPLALDERAPLAHANPVAKLGAAALVMTALFLAVDVVTPAVGLVAVLAAVPLTGVRAGQLLGRAWPLLVAAVAIGALNALFVADAGGGQAQLGPISISSGALVVGGSLALRVLGIALAGVAAFASIEPIDLADALVQQLHAPPRFAIGALAAVRLLPILAEEWWILGLARRARGVDGGRSPIARIGLLAGRLFALLVGAIRRAVQLSVAMDARGFDARSARSVARPQQMRRRDWLLLAGAAAAGVLATLVSLAVGSYRFILG